MPRQPFDDPAIAADDGLIRRIRPEWIVPGGVPGSLRVSSQAFKPSSSDGGVSVDLERKLHAAGLDYLYSLRGFPNFGAARLAARQARSMGLQVGADPLLETEPGGPNPYHAQIWGVATKSTERRLSKLATLQMLEWPNERTD